MASKEINFRKSLKLVNKDKLCVVKKDALDYLNGLMNKLNNKIITEFVRHSDNSRIPLKIDVLTDGILGGMVTGRLKDRIMENGKSAVLKFNHGRYEYAPEATERRWNKMNRKKFRGVIQLQKMIFPAGRLSKGAENYITEMLASSLMKLSEKAFNYAEINKKRELTDQHIKNAVLAQWPEEMKKLAVCEGARLVVHFEAGNCDFEPPKKKIRLK